MSTFEANEPDARAARARLERLAYLLDSAIPIPGFRFRLGVESLIGLIPGIGDAIGVILSSYILVAAANLGVGTPTIIRMVFNVAIEAVVGMVPLLGDIFDMAWRANQRNVRLLQEHLNNAAEVNRSSRMLIVGVGSLAMLLSTALAALAYLVVRALWHALAH